MSSTTPSYNPTASVGIKQLNPPELWFRSRNPLTSDYLNYDLGDIWINSPAKTVWILVNKLAGVATWDGIGGGGLTVETLTPDTGGAVTPIANNININGGLNISTMTGAPGQIFIDATEAAGFIWVPVPGAAQAMTPWVGYWTQNTSLTVFTLPAACPEGSIMRIAGIGTGGWALHQNAGQKIVVSRFSTTVGIGGSVQATAITDSIELLCVVADTIWLAVTYDGNLTIV